MGVTSVPVEKYRPPARGRHSLPLPSSRRPTPPVVGRATARGRVFRLADEFYLVAHDEVTGRARLARSVLGLGVAGALLGELALGGSVRVQGGQLVVVDHTPPADALAHLVLAEVLAEEHAQPVRAWLEFLAAGQAVDRVAGRLVRDGVLAARTGRRWWRTGPRYEPVDPAVGWPAARLGNRAERHEQLGVQERLLAGLVAATGLTRLVLAGRDAGAGAYLTRQVAALPEALAGLVDQVHAAVGEAVLTHRG